MTIAASNNEFPNNVLALIAARVPTFVDADIVPLMRPLRQTDPTQVVGIFPSMRRPDTTSYETGQRATGPAITRYSFIMQTFVLDTDEQACISVHSILSSRLWRMYTRDLALNAGLTVLAVDANNTHERFQRRGVELQRFISNEIQGTFMCTSWMECWFETETVET